MRIHAGRRGSMIRSSSKGFTLIELMVASLILLCAIGGLLYTFVSIQVMTESNRNLITAVNDAQFVLEQMKNLTYSQLGTYTAPALAHLNNETVTLTRSVGPKLANVTVTIRWTERQRSRSFELATRFAK